MHHQYQYGYKPEPCDDRSISALKRRVTRNIDRALALDDAMFQWKPAHLILVLTLTYNERWKDWMTLTDLRRDRDTMLNNLSFNTLLKGVNGYIWKLEEGQQGGGLHLHLVIYYDASRCSDEHDDVYFADAIKLYWEQVVTKGRGEAWNSNVSKRQNERSRFGDVTGLIHRDYTAKRHAFRRYLVEYVCKDKQQVSVRAPHCRMFGTSYIPE